MSLRFPVFAVDFNHRERAVVLALVYNGNPPRFFNVFFVVKISVCGFINVPDCRFVLFWFCRFACVIGSRLCCTGLRIGEFLALTADDFDMERHVIYVKSSKNSKSGNVNKPKTAAGVRKVYFNEDLLVGFDISTLGTYTYNAIKKAFKKALKQLNLTDISVTHSCRHTFASLLFAVGVNGKIIQRLMGHASITTTLDTYTDILMKGTSPIYEYISKLKSTLISTLI